LENSQVHHIFSLGNLDPLNLSSADHKKHGAMYVGFDNIPGTFFTKKYSNDPEKNVEYIKALKTQEHANALFAPIMDSIPEGAIISAEQMQKQNHPYNIIEDNQPFSTGCSLPHGCIQLVIEPHVDAPKTVSDSDLYLNPFVVQTVLEHFKCEGFVVKDGSGYKFKLKREYLSESNGNEAGESEPKQIGTHKTGPTNADGSPAQSFASRALTFYMDPVASCSSNLVLESHIFKVPVNVTNGETVEMEEIEMTANLVALSIPTVLENQLVNNNFKGQKMLGLFNTIGQRNTYRYDPNFVVNENVDTSSLTFEQKLDGETIMFKKVGNELKIMIKFQIDVYKNDVNKEDDGYSIGLFLK
jgi:hypothetical protein